MRKLIDVSSYNGKVDWEKAKAYGSMLPPLATSETALRCAMRMRIYG